MLDGVNPLIIQPNYLAGGRDIEEIIYNGTDQFQTFQAGKLPTPGANAMGYTTLGLVEFTPIGAGVNAGSRNIFVKPVYMPNPQVADIGTGHELGSIGNAPLMLNW